MIGIGVIEGFFGPEWPWESRHHFCKSLQSYGGQFYIYAPKRDAYLRKSWTQHHPAEMWGELKKISKTCSQNKIDFGVGLSPFEIHTHWNNQTKGQLKDKVRTLQDLEIKYLGLFFDDMKGAADLADKQIEIVDFIKNVAGCTLLFCPTYYSDDPILDKVFGQRSFDYLEKIGRLPADVQILWTGRKVISESISDEDLKKVASVIRRKPIIWDNYFANDGPKQCKFLKFKPLLGRDKNALDSSEGWAFNLMNQPRLSEILFASSVEVLRNNADPYEALKKMSRKIAGDEIEFVVQTYAKTFLESGLDNLNEKTKGELQGLLKDDDASQELLSWLAGKYTVGTECLTD